LDTRILIACSVLFFISTIAYNQAGTFTDPRDGQAYKTIEIDGKTWMAENLRYEIGDSKCYLNQQANCQEYGRYYEWSKAIGACPDGWHLPTRNEFAQLGNSLGILYSRNDIERKKEHLKNKEWEVLYEGGSSGFNAKLAGSYNQDLGWEGMGAWASFWTITKSRSEYTYWKIHPTNGGFTIWYLSWGDELLSVRCVKD